MPIQNRADEQVKIDLPETLPGIAAGEWVKVRAVFTAGMRRNVMRKAMTLRLAGGEVSAEDLDIFAYRQALLEEVVTAWSDGGEVTPEGLASMHTDVQDYIAEQYDALAGGRPEAEKKDSAGSSPPGLEATPAGASPQSSDT